VASLDGPLEPRDVMAGGLGAFWSEGHVVYGAQSALYARPADERTLQLRGGAIRLAEGLLLNWRNGYLPASAAAEGVLVFRTREAQDWRFTWIDRLGRRLGTVGESGAWNNFDLSPDGTRIAAAWLPADGSAQTLGLIDVRRNVTTRDAGPAGARISDPTWAPDGHLLAYRNGDRLVMRAADGGEETTLLDRMGYPDSFTRDGRFVLYGAPRDAYYELYALPCAATTGSRSRS
jgi:Tol biopolymer transport system component